MCSFSLLGFFKLKKNKEKEGIIILTCSTIDRSIMGPKKIKEIKQVAGQQTINLAALLQKKINDEKEEERKKKEEGDERRKEKHEGKTSEVITVHSSSASDDAKRMDDSARSPLGGPKPADVDCVKETRFANEEEKRVRGEDKTGKEKRRKGGVGANHRTKNPNLPIP